MTERQEQLAAYFEVVSQDPRVRGAGMDLGLVKQAVVACVLDDLGVIGRGLLRVASDRVRPVAREVARATGGRGRFGEFAGDTAARAIDAVFDAVNDALSGKRDG